MKKTLPTNNAALMNKLSLVTELLRKCDSFLKERSVFNLLIGYLLVVFEKCYTIRWTTDWDLIFRRDLNKIRWNLDEVKYEVNFKRGQWKKI